MIPGEASERWLGTDVEWSSMRARRRSQPSGAATADTAHSLHCALSPPSPHCPPSICIVHRSICPCCRCVSARCDRCVWSAEQRRSARGGRLDRRPLNAHPDQRPILTADNFDDVYIHHALTHSTRGDWSSLSALSSRRGCALHALPCSTISTVLVAPLSGQWPAIAASAAAASTTNAHRLGAEVIQRS
jgi:hypothetical protein